MNFAEKIQNAIKVLRENEPKENGYGLAFSGGKDSIVIKQLAIEAGVKFKAYYGDTTMDYPELQQFIKREHSEVEWIRQERGFLAEMIERGIDPSPLIRWCCAKYKENTIVGHTAKIIGVRASESIRRAKKWNFVVEDSHKAGCYIICPIFDWTDDDIWHFIASRKLKYCELYDNGYKRLGCIACPLASVEKRRKDFEQYPQFEKAFRKAFNLMWERWHNVIVQRPKSYLHLSSRYKNGDEWFNFYITRGHPETKEQCQMELMFTGVERKK